MQIAKLDVDVYQVTKENKILNGCLTSRQSFKISYCSDLK